MSEPDVDLEQPEQEPARGGSLPGPTYDNPNEDQHYRDPEVPDDEDDRR